MNWYRLVNDCTECQGLMNCLSVLRLWLIVTGYVETHDYLYLQQHSTSKEEKLVGSHNPWGGGGGGGSYSCSPVSFPHSEKKMK